MSDAQATMDAYSHDTPTACGYCGWRPTEASWQRSPQGRPYCPECGAIPSAHQRDWGPWE